MSVCVSVDENSSVGVWARKEPLLKDKQPRTAPTKSVYGGPAGASCSLPGAQDTDAGGLRQTCSPHMRSVTNMADGLSVLTGNTGKGKGGKEVETRLTGRWPVKEPRKEHVQHGQPGEGRDAPVRPHSKACRVHTPGQSLQAWGLPRQSSTTERELEVPTNKHNRPRHLLAPL